MAKCIANKDKILFGNFIKAFCFLTFILLFIYSVYNLGTYTVRAKDYKELTNFKYIVADADGIKEVDEYILKQEKVGKKVYILDARAALYMIPLDKYNKDFDMFMNGNFGAGRRR